MAIEHVDRVKKVSSHVRIDGWTIVVGAIAVLIASPILVVLGSVFTPSSRDIWSHLASTVLPTYILQSFWLMVGVSFGVTVIGVSTAWLVTTCQFPGRRVFEWALLLPLAAPAYILAYVYTDVLEFYGPVQSSLRQLFGWSSVNDYWFPEIRSIGGAIAMLTLVLYPYVYLITRVAFLDQSVCTLEASRALGCNPWSSFFRVALPLARPAIMGGVALALMETLNDFGTVQFFGVETFTTGIYRTWFGLGERIAASQLSALLLTFILALLALEQWSRRRTKYYQSHNSQQPFSAYNLHSWRAVGAALICALPIGLGFLIPAVVLAEMAIADMTDNFSAGFWQYASNSLVLATLTAGLAVVLALIMAYGLRLRPKPSMAAAVRVASIGYAVPGAVIAVGILMPLGRFDNWLDQWMRNLFGISTGLLLSGTIVALVFAYLVRFLAVSYNTVQSSLSRIKPSLDDASHSLGYGSVSTLLKIHAPLMGGGLVTAAILVFVDVMKELPATLIVRPFNFDTLAVQVYRLASDERLAEAAAPALAIVLVGLIPVMLLSWQVSRSQSNPS